MRIVARCTDGAGCLDAIHAFEPDIAILDLSMPDMSGLDDLTRANADGSYDQVCLFHFDEAPEIDNQIAVSPSRYRRHDPAQASEIA